MDFNPNTFSPLTTLTGELAGIDPDVTRNAFPPRGAKEGFYRRLNELPNDVLKQISNGELKVAPGNIMVVKPLKDNVKMFEDSDSKQNGTSNVEKAKIDVGEYFMYSHIQVLVGTAVSDSKEDQANIEWSSVGSIPNARNGHFSFKVGSDTHIDQRTSMEIFEIYGHGQIREGQLVIDDPKWINPQQEMKFEIELPDDSNVPQFSYVKLVMDGLKLTSS